MSHKRTLIWEAVGPGCARCRDGGSKANKGEQAESRGKLGWRKIMTVALVPGLVFMLEIKVRGKHGCPPGRDLLQLGLDGKGLQVGECQLC